MQGVKRKAVNVPRGCLHACSRVYYFMGRHGRREKELAGGFALEPIAVYITRTRSENVARARELREAPLTGL